jgi:hypothetical protein
VKPKEQGIPTETPATQYTPAGHCVAIDTLAMQNEPAGHWVGETLLAGQKLPALQLCFTKGVVQ